MNKLGADLLNVCERERVLIGAVKRLAEASQLDFWAVSKLVQTKSP